MSGVDNRIVTMQFNNREFEQNAKTSMTTLQKLKESLDFGKIAGGAIRGLGAIESALSKIGLKTPFSPMIKAANTGLLGVGTVLDKIGMKNPFASGVQGANDLQRAAQQAGGPSGMGYLEGGVTAVSGKFIALSTIAITALSNITNRAVNAGAMWLKSFTVAPVMDGLNEYQTTLQSIQTVQANTDQPLKKIEESLEQLNTYSDQTIYNFGQMARNVGTFTAAGVDLKTSVASIQGIANIAALSGSSSEQAATAMYQLSQAIAAGRVGLQDWNSVVNAGMGGKKLQNQLAQTAVAMGKIQPSDVQIDKMGKLTIQGESFRNSIMAKPGQESWLSSDILTNTLASLDGRFSRNYQLSLLNADGTKKFTEKQVDANMALARTNLEKKNGVKFSEEQYTALKKMASSATDAATQVKTLGQVFDIAKETIGSGWAASFKSIFGNLKESKKLFTGMSDGLGNIIRQNALARNNLLAKWKELGGRDTLIDGLKTAWKSFYSVIQAVGRGFRSVFPKKSPEGLVAMTKSFADLMHRMTPSIETLVAITRIAKGFFSIFSIGKTILSAAVNMFKNLFVSLGGGQGDMLLFAAKIGTAISRFDEFLKKGDSVKQFFDGLGQIIAVPLSVLKGLGTLLASLFGGFSTDKAQDAIGGVGDKLSGLEAVASKIANFFGKLGNLFSHVGETIGKALVGIGDLIANMFTPETFSQTLDVINTSLLGALVLLIRNFFKSGVNVDLSGGLFDGIKETLGAVTSGFQTMQQNLKANILLKLAAAIGVMALALLVLSGIDPKALTKALAAMSGGFAVLIGAMATLLKVMGPAGLVQLYVATSAMTKMALSILLLSFALKQMSKIAFPDMLRGLVGLGAALVIVSKAILPLAAGSKGMAKASTSLILIGIAINILAIALKIFATMSWEEMIKGLAGLTGTLIALSVGLKLMPPLQAEALGLLALGVALNAIAVAMKIFATMSWEEMAKGVVSIAGALLAISAAINTMPKTMILQSVALVAVSGALVILAGALKVMGSMGWEEIAKGLVVLGGAMLILALGLNGIGVVGTVGAAGMLAAVGALVLLAPVLLAFGAMKISTIAKSLGMLAGIFLILAAAGYGLAPVVPVLIGIGIAMTLMGAALALAGAGALAFATAFGIIVGTGAAGIQILTGLLQTVVNAIPGALAALAAGIVLFVQTLGINAPIIAQAFGQILISLLNTAQQAIPRLGQVFLTLLDTIIKVLVKGVPKIATAGLKIMSSLLGAIAKQLPKLIDKGADVVVKFLQGLGRNSKKVVDAGLKLVLDLMDALAVGIQDNSKEFGKKGAEIGIAIIEGTLKGIAGGAGAIIKKLKSIAKDAWNGAKKFFGIGGPSKLMRDTVGKKVSEGLADGIADSGPKAIQEIGDLGKRAVRKMDNVVRSVDAAFALNTDLSRPTIAPVLDLSGVTKEAGKMSNILANAPVMATVSYETASDISTMTQSTTDNGPGSDDPENSGGGPTVDLTLNLNSPKPIDSVESYRAGKTLISLAKEALQS